MQWSSSTLQAFLLLLAIPETLAAPAAAGISLPRNIFGLQRRQTQQNANEQSWIKKWAAVGDSYAAGIGAGNRIDYSCSRYDSSYANLLNSSPRMSGTQTFEFLACSGAKSPDVEKQVAQLSSGYDMITVSSGGNDVGLVDLLNECVYTWNPKIGCEKTIANSKDLIQNTLPKNLDSLYGKLKGKVGQGTVYVTSYGRFFDETSNDCDKVSWHWFTFPVNWLNWQYLTVDRRKAMNELVDLVNEQIRQAVKRAGSQFVVVEWDSAFGTFEGRYCMPGVQEPQPNRDQLMFYLDGTTESSKKKRQNEDGFPEGSFEAQVQGLIKEGQDTIKANMSDSDPKPQSLISLPIPDNWARVFHPLKKGHAIIASKIFFHMAQTRAKQLNIGQGADIVDLSAGTCTIKPPLPSNPAIGTQGELSANFPKYWILGDGKQHDITDMYYRLRDKTCQNICDASAIADVPSQFVRATRVGDEGCAYSVKISNDKELYLYATQDGSNCYQATEQLLTQHGKTKESAW
ncbi:SGNH hydrolase [Pseudovirgaria hyperparasitica]|uniref:SGNH hydrolase n=1 Tax=Pseudovirgaria hyperparasitica TaxID=470096 RepID=A0A6A6WI28_9PEZI|nr:SGNH hydrolase [Pseudovirgaria hyperparasitica]KAF2761889.1 SGNH hydrolase [Pseudovirgaria hyperparasitica]